MNTLKEITEDLRTAIREGEELEDIRDNSGEWVDGYVPVYNNRIIEEWQSMPAEYDNRGALELGYSGDADIIRQMQLDLYLYYSDLVAEALTDIESEIEESSL